MKITAIRQQVKLKDRYSIYVDESYSFSLSESALLRSGLMLGAELDAEKLSAMQQLSRDDKAYGRVVRYIALRPRSTWEVQDYMRRKDIDEMSQQTILERLKSYGLLDDEAFARSWVESRRLLKPISVRKLQIELQQKHIPREIIDIVLRDDRAVTDEREVLRDVVRRRARRYPDKTKFMQYLARQGFQYEDIKTVLDEELSKDS